MLRKLSYTLLLIAIAFVFWPSCVEKAAYAAVSLEELPTPPEPIPGSVASPVGGNHILVTGGQNGSNAMSKNSYIFDTVSQTWSSSAPLPLAYHNQSTLSNGSVLVTGGNVFTNGVGYIYNDQARIYNPSTNTWSNAANVPHTVIGHTQSTLTDGRVLIAGGADSIYSPSSDSLLYSNAYIYDPSENRWEEAAPLPRGLYGAAQSTLKDGRVLVTGGLSGFVYSFFSYIYDPAANTWTTVATMPYSGGDLFYNHAQVTLENGKVLVMGNYNFYIYDPATNTWTKDIENPGNMVDASLVKIGSAVYVIGGYNYTDYSINTKFYKLSFDFNAPTPPTIAGAGSGWTASDVDITISPGTDAETGVNRTEYSLSGATLLGWTTYDEASPIRISNSGQTTVTARTIDHAGNISTAALAVVKIDRTPPATPTINLSASGWSSKSVSVWFSSSLDSGGSGVQRIEYSLSGAVTAAWKTYTAGFEILGQGQTTVHVRAIDNVGNASAEGTAVIMIDKTAPGAPSITPASGTWSNTDITVAIVSGTDTGGSGVSRTEYKLTGAATSNWTTYASPILIGAGGQTTVEARTIDNAGNISTSKSITLKLDKTQPTAPTVTPGTTNWTNAASVRVTVTPGTDGGSGVARTEYSLSGAATLDWTTYTGQVTVNAEGQTTLSARTVDNAGNVGPVTTSVVKIDRTAPAVPAITPSTTAWTAADASFTLTAGTDTGGSGAARTEFSLSGAVTSGWTTYTGAVTITAEGQTTIHARTIDQAGNISTESTSVISIDQTKPAVPVITPVGSDWNASNVTVTVAAGTDVGGSGVNKTEYKLSGAIMRDWTAYTGAVSISAEGQTTVEARTIDNAGNTSTAAPVIVKLDKTKPAVPVVTPDLTAWTNAASVKVTITPGTDSGSGISLTEYSLSGASTLAWTTYTGQISITSEGQTTINARSIDNAGNVGPVSTGVVKIDRSSPSAPAISPAGGDWSGSSISVTMTAGADNASSADRVEYKLTGVTTLGWTTYTEPINLRAEGKTTVTARTVDKAGNISTESEEVQSIDLTAPGAALLTSEESGWTSSAGVTVTALAGTDSGGSGVKRIEYRLSGAITTDWKPYTGPIIVTEEGQTEVSARTIDNAGHIGASTKVTVQLDRTSPTSPEVAASAADWTKENVGITITPGTDSLSGASLTEYSLTGAANADWTTYSGEITVTAEGQTTVHARTVDQAGNRSEMTDLKVYIDKTVPVSPEIRIGKTGWNSADKVDFSITPAAEQGGSGVSRIEYRLSGAVTKDWTEYSNTADIEAEGLTTISARTIDAAGNVGAQQEATVKIDRSSPAAPTVVPETTEWTSADSVKVTVTAGTDLGESGIERTEYRITGAGAKEWATYEGELTITAEGESIISTRSIDKAGNIGSVAEAVVRIDRTPPPAPVVLEPADGELFADNTPAISGTAEANSIVTVMIDGSTLPVVTADRDGKWKAQLVHALADGVHHALISVKDPVGNTAAESAELTFTIDAIAPEAPVIEAPVHGAMTSNNKPVFKGQAEANSKVTLYIGDTPVKTVTASGGGIWTFTMTEPLEDGVYLLKAAAKDAAGNVSEISNSVSWTIDTKEPVAPVVLAPVEGTITKGNKVTISGTAEAGATVRVFMDDHQVVEGKASNSGAWSFTLTEELPDGKHTIRASAEDEAGNIGLHSEEIYFTIDTAAPDLAIISDPTEGALLNTAKPVITGQAEAGAWINLTMDGSAIDPLKSDEEGSWSFSPASSLMDGAHQLKVKVADEAGNVREDAVQLNFVVDTAAPAVPFVTKPDEDSRTNQTKPEISGTAEKLSKITIRIDGEVAGVAEADDLGNWRFVPKTDLIIGGHSIQVIAADAAGNESESSSNYHFEIVSSNANLSELKLSDIRMNEPFLNKTLNYTAGVTYSVSTTKMTAVPDDTRAKVDILNEKGEPLEELIDLSVGTQIITIRVTAQDGTTIQTYTVTITRYNPVSPPQVEPEEPEEPEEASPVELVACKPAEKSTSAFADMTGHWAEETVRDAYGCGVVHGFNDGTFRPEGHVSRAEFVTMLMNAVIDKAAPAGSESEFSDDGNIPVWAAQAIARAKDFGIVNGYADGSFRPNEQVRRAELVTMLAKAAGIKPLEPEKVKELFSDASDIPAWAAGYVAALQQAGILQGRGDGKFEPSGQATRAEAAVLLLRIIDFSHH
ncbi:N-acetylneuraminic acid mutarotase [Paenibacillus catalpae]|uniref:N-acetylneuraminic acid mutarotase n=1 Tax=Paenibacillus catalpae TaxID=1045775 RepID=A0A1I1U4D2_9BACL|nr:Ig-like domain-containing protein [Paenibacillus catalpae]SFD65711.1 N-acetylneuraminic acid mutarotase [Paenibacillus catalpae]